MAFLIDIGTTIVAKLAEYTIEPVIRQVGYVICYNKNLKKLQTRVGDLGDARESMKHVVETEERKGKKIETEVQNWLTKVDQLTKEADDLNDKHLAQTKCLHGFCPNLKLRHHLSRKSTKLVLEVAELHEKKNNFVDFAYVDSTEVVCIQNYEAFDSRTSTAMAVINELRNSDTYMIGVYGIGGVGKTTLVKEVNNQLATSGEKLFDEVVMIRDLKHDPSIERIQKEMAEKLGLELPENGTRAGRAGLISNRIKDKKKKTLVILDDVWESIDLEAVGLPRMATIKILLTSRTKTVLAQDMGTQKDFPLQELNKEESWRLFQKMAGDIVENPDIQKIATQVAERCGGLPLLIVTVARSLKDSPLYDWKDTFRRLKNFDGKGLEEKTHAAIEWSYDKLNSDELKSVFLLCASESWNTNFIHVLDLLKYSMGLGFIKDVETMEEARDALHSLLKKLQHSCLLLDTGNNEWVRIHDLVKHVAKHIAARDHHVLSVSHGSELKQWPDMEFRGKCRRISVKYCRTPELPEVLQCPELTMLVLFRAHDDSSREIPSNFFKEMKKLKVLDLTDWSIASLPPSLKFPKDLQTLCLHQCTLEDIALVGELQNLKILSFLQSKFKELPEEIGQLTRLQLLDLTGCSQLEVISPDVISKLKRLEELRMGENSFNKWEAGRVGETKRSNASLDELKYLPRLTALQIHIPDGTILPANLFPTGKLERFQICIGSVWKWDDVDEALNALKLKLTSYNELDQGLKMLLRRTQDLHVEGMEDVNDKFFRELATGGYQQLKHLHVQNNAKFAYTINEKAGFPNLTWLAVSELKSLRFLLSSSMARSLSQVKRLQISGCQFMKVVISIEESNKELAENLLPQLQDLELNGLPNLTKFCSTCERLEDFTESAGICEEVEEIDSKENLDFVIQHFLFENKGEFPNMKKLSLNGLAKLTTIWNNQVSLGSSKNLETIKIVSCDNLKSVFPASVAKSLQQLSSLKVKNCGVEEIISKEDDVQTTPMFVFSKLTYVRFVNLPQLKSFDPGLHSTDKNRLNTEIEDIESARLMQRSLFNNKVELPKLTRLTLKGLTKLTTIWNKQIQDTSAAPFDCENLEDVDIDSCENLENIFPLWVARNLQQLRFLSVTDCGVKEIVAREERLQTAFKFVFPKVTHVLFMNLSQLINFYPGTHVCSWPLLNYLSVLECDKVDIFVEEFSSFQEKLDGNSSSNLTNRQFLFSIEKDSFPNLEQLDLNAMEFSNGPLPAAAQLFGKLKKLEVCCPESKSLVFLDKLLLDPQGSSTASAVRITTQQFPHLKELRLDGMEKLMHLGQDDEEDNSQSATRIPNIPNLQILFASDCDSLRNLRSSAISFDNLTTLQVSFCDGLEYLITYSMAKSLMQLTKLEVRDCEEMIEIVASSGNDVARNEIEFKMLKHLELSALPSMRGFCSGTHTVKFPSLENLCMTGCTQLEGFILDVTTDKNRLGNEIEDIESARLMERFLFDNKVELPKLTRLTLEGLTKLTTVWNKQIQNTSAPPQPSSFGCENLEYVEIDSCASLRNIFPLWVARNLQQLQTLIVKNCGVKDDDDSSSNFFKDMKKLIVLDLTDWRIASLPPSLKFLKDLQTLRLHQCTLEDIALVGELQNLKILSFLQSKFKELPEEIGQLTRLQLLDLTGCSQLEVISPDVISKLKRLEELRMGKNSFNKWEAGRVGETKRSNASLEELRYLPRLTALHVHIPDATILPANVFTTSKLERFQICIGSVWKWDDVDEALNGLKLKLTSYNELDQGLKMLLKKTQDLYVEGMEDVNDKLFRELATGGYQQLKHLHVQNNAKFAYTINEKVGFSNLTWLAVSELKSLRFLLSSSMARSLSQVKRLQISGCQFMKVVISIEESNKELAENFFPQLQDLELNGLPNLTKFCSTCERLEDCTESAGICEEVEEIDSKGNLDFVMQHFLFENKGEFPNMKKLSLNGLAKLTTIWTNQVSLGSSKNLETIEIVSCDNLKSVFPASVAKSLMQLTKLKVSDCEEMIEIVASSGNDVARNEIEFKMLKHLELSALPSLRGFCSGTHIVKFPSLENLCMAGCTQLEGFILDVTTDKNRLDNEIEDIESARLMQRSLFDNKVELPKLTRLTLKGLTKLTTIWNKQIQDTSAAPFDCENLEDVDIDSCENLENIFPLWVARNLQQLQTLIVVNCGVKEIVAREERLQTAFKFVFPKVTHVFFMNLSQLINFYPGTHVCSWPLLNDLAVFNCDKVDIFVEEFSSFQEKLDGNSSSTLTNRQFLFSIEKDSFPNLERLSLDGPLPAAAQFFGKLKELAVCCPESKSLVFLDKLLLDPQGSSTASAVGITTQQFPRLKELRLEMEKLMHLGQDDEEDNSQSATRIPNIPNLEILQVMGCHSLRNLRSSAISFDNLTTLQVSCCKGLKYLISISMAKSLMQLTKLEVGDCEEMIEIVASSGNDVARNEIEFKMLKHLTLSALPSLRGFCSGTHTVKFPSLENLCMTGCTQLEGFIPDVTTDKNRLGNEIEDIGSARLMQRSLFDNKVELPKLTSLTLRGLTKLTTIWNKQIQNTSAAPFDCENLEHVVIDSCENLENIFPLWVARNLQQLQTLIVNNCGVKEIVAREERLETVFKFVFPKVTYVLFDNLSELTNFYPGMHVCSWPLLNYLGVFKCGKVDIFAEEFSSFQEKLDGNSSSALTNRQFLFSIEKDSFPKLEWLGLNAMEFSNGPLPAAAQFFGKLKKLDVCCPESKSLVFLDKLLLDPEGSSTASAVGITTQQFPHLKELRLVRMKKLMHLGQDDEEDDSQSATRIPNIPNLQTLFASGCDSLRNLRSSAISFDNLTTLQVSFCYGLEYLITYSTANSLTQLTTLEVWYCPRLVQIVGSNEDHDSRNEITLPRLKHLKLSVLPRLQSFCSGNCLAKLPSLETSTMSNRLKLKIFAADDQTLQLITNEGDDTDVDDLVARYPAEE